MSPASGRPPSKDPKKHDTRIRMSDSDVEKLDFCCKIFNTTKTNIIRQGIDIMYERAKKEQ